MAKFLKGNELNSELEKIFETATSNIILISPYIKLHDRYKSSLLTKINNDDLKISVLFGKNEEDMSKSMKEEDFAFFKQFPNIEILFENRLHAKYYANELKAMLTSMNLYGFSQNNNIETGVLMEKTLKGKLTGENNLDNDAWEYFLRVLKQADLLFKKEPVYEKKNFLSARKYIKSEIITDTLSGFFITKKEKKVFTKQVVKQGNSGSTNIKKDTGYCIRTGKEIIFNIEKPMQYESFKMWNTYKNKDFSEKYCHFTGELSNGKTSMGKPILAKNWKKAKEKFKF